MHLSHLNFFNEKQLKEKHARAKQLLDSYNLKVYKEKQAANLEHYNLKKHLLIQLQQEFCLLLVHILGKVQATKKNLVFKKFKYRLAKLQKNSHRFSKTPKVTSPNHFMAWDVNKKVNSELTKRASNDEDIKPKIG